MSNAMTEEEVRAKFSGLFARAYEIMDSNDKHDLIMMALQGFAESEENFKEFLQEIKDLDEVTIVSSGEPNEAESDNVEKLVGMILGEFGMLHPDELDKLVEATAKRFLDDPPRRKCDHGQLYAHLVVDITMPVKHNSAVEMTRVYDRIHAVLTDGVSNCDYKVRSGITVDEDPKVGE